MQTHLEQDVQETPRSLFQAHFHVFLLVFSFSPSLAVKYFNINQKEQRRIGDRSDNEG